MSKREIAARILDNKLVRGVWRATGRFRKGLRILAYHRVIDETPNTFPYDEEVISATSEAFYQQMKFVSSNFEVISFADLHRCEIEGKRWPNRALIVTFDDGYKDNYTHAYPILKEFKIPATIFLVTGHIGQKKLFWWDMVAYCIKHTPLQAKEFPEVSHQTLRLSNAQEKEFAIRLILGWIKHVPDDISRKFLQRLPAELRVEMPASVGEGLHLSWDEIREMAKHRIEFGSHTVTHPILANISEAQLEREISESKKTIEREIGKEIISLAYPVGRKTKFNQLAQQITARHGFRYAVSYEEGVVFQKDYDRFAMQRVHVELEYSKSLFRANLMFPHLILGGNRWPHLALEYQEALLASSEIAPGG
jgi:peptidoglycan/xylan/chitin deacetylase (PgdA/CDA1 family)